MEIAVSNCLSCDTFAGMWGHHCGSGCSDEERSVHVGLVYCTMISMAQRTGAHGETNMEMSFSP